MSQRDIRRACCQRDVDFHIIMCRNAQSQTCRADGAEIGGLQIFLPQMDAVCLMLDRQSPVIINKQSRVIAAAQRNCRHDIGFHLFIALIFDA
ncbi:hypothetical protein ExPUPEC79_03745 [Escherichia coli]|nr:hypothetical protein ExPUPEC79_03745 [Escherichia coli]